MALFPLRNSRALYLLLREYGNGTAQAALKTVWARVFGSVIVSPKWWL